MSHDENIRWLEDVSAYFEAAKVEGKWRLAEGVIADLREKGFPLEADELQLELNKARMDPV